MSDSTQNKYWLLKAEPDSRVVKGKDVKFSVDDFERVNTSPWEGVRNYEARNLMKEMKVGDKALFYHSNCKNPGVAAFAQVAKEAYPDYTAWDPSHPYYDPKSDSEEPRWFMVDLSFSSRAKNFVPLSLLRFLADTSPADLSETIEYIGETGLQAIKGMDLVRRGRLSVQRVNRDAWDTIELLAEKGGWEELDLKTKKPTAGKGRGRGKRETKREGPNDESEHEQLSDSKATNIKEKEKVELDGIVEDGQGSPDISSDKIPATSKATSVTAKRKRKVGDVGEHATDLPTRKSTRTKR